MLTLETTIKIIAALKHAEEVKKQLNDSRGPCWSHKDFCSCSRHELCNIALAHFLKKNPGNLTRQWQTIEILMKDVIYTRKISGPNNRPRRFLQLTESWERALVRVVENTWDQLSMPTP